MNLYFRHPHLPLNHCIPSTELRRLKATLSLAYRGSLDPNHILYGLLSGSSDVFQERLRSRRPCVPTARNLLNNLGTWHPRFPVDQKYRWNAENCENTSRLLVFIPRTSARSVEISYRDKNKKNENNKLASNSLCQV